MKEEVQDMLPLVSITACFPGVTFPVCCGSPVSVMIFIYPSVVCCPYVALQTQHLGQQSLGAFNTHVLDCSSGRRYDFGGGCYLLGRSFAA